MERPPIPGVTDILPEPSARIFNFHTTGSTVVRGASYKIERILIDGGAVVNLMPEAAARRIGLDLVPNNDILIRTATNELRPVKYYTRLDIKIAGVIASVKVYVIDIPQSYSLLLGRGWLYQVRAIVRKSLLYHFQYKGETPFRTP